MKKWQTKQQKYDLDKMLRKINFKVKAMKLCIGKGSYKENNYKKINLTSI